MSAADLDFNRSDTSPALPAGVPGVRIRVVATSEHGDFTALRLYGAYQVSAADAEALGARPLQRALVVTASSGMWFEAWNLVGEAITFPDDEQRAGDMVRGYFNVDLLRRVDVRPYGTGYVLVSLGPMLSNIEAFTAG